MSHDELADFAGPYAIGALDGDEVLLFSEHLLECWECRKAVMEYDEVYADGAKGLEPVEPSAGARKALLARVSGTQVALDPKPTSKRDSRRFAWQLVLVAAASFLLAVSYMGDAKDTERERDAGAAVLALFSEPGAETRSLSGQDPSPGASGRVVWDKTRIGLTTRGLPDLPEGSAYQLWAITGDSKQGVGLFLGAHGAVQGVTTLLARIPDGVSAFALTVEPASGSPSPTGRIYLLSGS